MKVISLIISAMLSGLSVVAHDWHRDEDPHFATLQPEMVQERESNLDGWRTIQLTTAVSAHTTIVPSAKPSIEAVFGPFAPKVSTRSDARWFYVESDGLPAHNMMVGISAWQQQVPLPQSYTGDNAWRIPLHPVAATNPASIRNRFLRGAIALAANGIPIFNPQNNRGGLSQEIGELDQWGGHCGRADDYHYHVAPLHLQSVLGKSLPIAYALDGYAIYGMTEPNGSAPAKLDSFNGHESATLGYHYHSSTKYPYVNGGFHGEISEAGGQVDPQPRAQGVRQALQALRGAKITNFTMKNERSHSLQYSIDNETRYVNYTLNDDKTVKFDFVDARGLVRSETYSPNQHGGDGDRPSRRLDRNGGRRKGPEPGGSLASAGGPPNDREEPQPSREKGSFVAAEDFAPQRSGNFVLSSSAVADGGALPVEFTGDGSSSTLPLEWTGAPAKTKSFAVIMHHIAPDGKIKWYWTLYNIPGEARGLPKNVQGIGTLGSNSINRRVGYAPPHSKGPGAKTYILTVYALSAPPEISVVPPEVSREVLIAAIKDRILDSAELKVVYNRTNLDTQRTIKAIP